MVTQPDVKALPFRTRRVCTDVLMLVVFLASLGGLCWLCRYALLEGDMKKILHGQDYMSDVCGQDNRNCERLVRRADILELRLAVFRSRAQADSADLEGRTQSFETTVPFYTFPMSELDGWSSTAVCLDECPTVPSIGNSSDEVPSSWVCTGKYRHGPPASCPGGWGEEEECVAFRNALFTRVGLAELDRCNDPLSDCDVCFPPYHTLPMIYYCLPDPRHALESFETAAISIATVGNAVGNTVRQPVAIRGPNGTLTWQRPNGLSVTDMENMRNFVSSAPHLAYEDIRVSLPVIACCLAFAFVFGLVWMVLLRFWAAFMVWLTLVTIGAGMGVAAWWLHQRQAWMREDERYGSDDLFTYQCDLFYAWFFILIAIGALYCLFVLCLLHQISIAVRVMKVSAKAVSSLPLLLLTPLLTLVCVMGVCAYGVYVALLLVSIGELKVGRSGFGHLTIELSTLGLLALHVFGVLWVTWWLKHLQHATVAGAVVQWYFARGIACSPVIASYCTAIRYHTGSLALGSLLISVLQVVRFVVLFLLRRFSSCQVHSSRMCDMCCACLNCCLGCLQRIVRYISRNAYIQMMIGGKSFCSSAMEALGLLTSNAVQVTAVRSVAWGFLLVGKLFVAAVQVTAVRSVAWGFLLVGKLFVAAAAAGVGALVLLTQKPYDTELYSIAAPVTVIAIGAWIIAVAFMGVYNMTIDTIFICFCVDQQRAKRGEPMFRTRLNNGGKPLMASQQSSRSSRRRLTSVPPEVTSTRPPGDADAVVTGVAVQKPPGVTHGNPFDIDAGSWRA
eukprot:CAMPEP_0182845464 /NCGR_PEP_ID=MMETSP0006_2-20121128/27347_1 /TAXON_ID=97485 /ORGANISM="Prymnesium parvum, Strain Texoma1" /LENGTH=787 /DNA_ID=CAMNT_0024975549 /DNA_START=246 /DNA_END=2611 /DNA_ORIENTATION=+